MTDEQSAKRALEQDILAALVERARAGDIAAVHWLQQNGFIFCDLPMTGRQHRYIKVLLKERGIDEDGATYHGHPISDLTIDQASEVIDQLKRQAETEDG